ncbi:MAG TPA: kelch repeat-containing protein [Patescibacteria group bacterium]|nr:kelch repeat-containing protein [Patescibacteria group bacterium]
MRANLRWGVAAVTVIALAACSRLAPVGQLTASPSTASSCSATGTGPSAPPPRANAALAFDVDRKQLVLFGGVSSGQTPGSYDDTWTWDGGWTLQHPTQSPAGASSAGMAYDPIHHVMVLYVPAGSPGASPETWTWDGSNWTRQNPAHLPPSRIEPAMAADPVRGGVILVGGTAAGDRSDIWAWNGSDWTEVLADQGPVFGAAHAIAVSPKDDSIVVTGNVGAYQFAAGAWKSLGVPWPDTNDFADNVAYANGIGFVRFSDRAETMIWRPGQDTAWQSLTPACAPTAGWTDTRRPAMAYDEWLNVVVLLAGVGHSETWIFDGHSWAPGAQASPNTTPTSPRPTGAGAWSPMPNLASGRLDQTATRLLDGRVLVVGGSLESEVNALATAEIFDPKADRWSTAAPMASPRARHTATRLQDGRVLVVGGLGPGRGTAELYDPSTNTWSGAGKLAQGRANHAAVLMPDGNVLVVGGRLPGQPLASAEVYDPRLNTWTAVGALPTPRDRPQAVLLDTGKVLVTGGVAVDTGGSLDASVLFGSPLATTEIYDPGTQTWSDGPSMSIGRVGHVMVTLGDGRVLVAGGTRDPAPAEIFDPVAGTWTATAVVPARIAPAAGLLPDGRVIVAGGLVEQYDPQTVASTGYTPILLTTADLFQPSSFSWLAAAPLSTGRWLSSGTVLSDGRFLVCGGGNPLAAGVDAVEAFSLN